MGIVYFKKDVPKTPFYLNNGRKVAFETLDNQTGYLAITNPQTIEEFRVAQASHVGGISEITKSEYDAFLKKKALGLKPSDQDWREEIAPMAPPIQTAGVAIAEPASDEPSDFITPPAAPAPATRPTATRRKTLA